MFGPPPAINYTGSDISEQALTIARRKRPDWSFANRTIDQCDSGSFDNTSCIDVLIHQPTTMAAQALADDLVQVARKGVIFSIHSQAIQGSGISFDSSGIKDHIANLPQVSAVHEIGSYRDTTLYFAEKGMGERLTHHDISLQELAIGARFQDDPVLLQDLVAYSRAKNRVLSAHSDPDARISVVCHPDGGLCTAENP